MEEEAGHEIHVEKQRRTSALDGKSTKTGMIGLTGMLSRCAAPILRRPATTSQRQAETNGWFAPATVKLSGRRVEAGLGDREVASAYARLAARMVSSTAICSLYARIAIANAWAAFRYARMRRFPHSNVT